MLDRIFPLMNITLPNKIALPTSSKSSLENILKAIIENKILKNNGVIIIHRHKKEIEAFPKNFHLIDEKKYGISKIMFGSCS